MSPLARPRDRGSRVYGEKHVEKARDTYLSLKPYSTHTVRGLYWLKLSPYFTLFSRMYVPPLPRIQYRSMGLGGHDGDTIYVRFNVAYGAPAPREGVQSEEGVHFRDGGTSACSQQGGTDTSAEPIYTAKGYSRSQ